MAPVLDLDSQCFFFSVNSVLSWSAWHLKKIKTVFYAAYLCGSHIMFIELSGCFTNVHHWAFCAVYFVCFFFGRGCYGVGRLNYVLDFFMVVGIIIIIGLCLYLSSVDFVGFAFGVVQKIIRVLEDMKVFTMYFSSPESPDFWQYIGNMVTLFDLYIDTHICRRTHTTVLK